MNQMELKTHECLQFFLPRLTVALEDIANELKAQKAQKQYSAETLKQAIQMLKGEQQ